MSEAREPGAASGELASLMERAESLYRDHRLGSVRAWKTATGGLAIGFMPIYIPRELLHAQGALPVGLMGGGDDLEVIRGDAYYQSYICRIPRSTVELGLNGSYDCLDGVIFPAICDVIRNLSGIWTMQFPHMMVKYLDVPQNFERGVGGRFFRSELESLSAELSARGAAEYDAEALRGSIARYHECARAVRRLYDLRRAQPWRIPTAELYILMRAGLVVPVEEFIGMLEAYERAALAAADRPPMDQARVVLTGSFCEQPPLGLIRTLERSGCYIVDDDFVQVHRFIEGEIPLDGDPLDRLVEAFLDRSMPGPTRYIGDDAKGRDLVDRARRSDAEGIVFCAPSFCDPALLDQPMTVRAVEGAGIPWTSFKYAENSGQFQVIREQAGTFADSIKLWSGS
ncbi:MAG TPA: benzoyl-CoA reductase subunit C [Candidatus Polarisedimenticolia bacterium]|nr:benzoyl-CoA reductase subunit C [Candidatus Polarisedimenticolia bacterium]